MRDQSVSLQMRLTHLLEAWKIFVTLGFISNGQHLSKQIDKTILKGLKGKKTEKCFQAHGNKSLSLYTGLHCFAHISRTYFYCHSLWQFNSSCFSLVGQNMSPPWMILLLICTRFVSFLCLRSCPTCSPVDSCCVLQTRGPYV